MPEEELPFKFTNHLRERYQQRILDDHSGVPRKDIDYLLARNLHRAKENRTYLTTPRFVLHLYEKYGAIDGLRIYESELATYVTKRNKGDGYRMVVTCWRRQPDNYYLKTFEKSALSNAEIYLRIAQYKAKAKMRK